MGSEGRDKEGFDIRIYLIATATYYMLVSGKIGEKEKGRIEQDSVYYHRIPSRFLISQYQFDNRRHTVDKCLNSLCQSIT